MRNFLKNPVRKIHIDKNDNKKFKLGAYSCHINILIFNILTQQS